MHIGIYMRQLFSTWGGAQNSGTQLANAMLARGHDVTVFYHWDQEDAPVPFFPLSPGITLCALNMSGAFSIAESDSFLPQNREAVRASGIEVFVALVFNSEMMACPALLRTTGIPLLLAVRNCPEMICRERWNADEYYACMAAADRIQLLLPGFLAHYPEFLRERVRIIPNTMESPGLNADAAARSHTGNVLLAAGRFAETHKQFSLLIEAFSLLAADFPAWNLVLCGDGKGRRLYAGMIRRLGLSRRVALPGMIPDMASYYSGADLFCIPSRYEGFPRVLLEAYAFGLPAVGFASCPGTNEIIMHGENGLLAEEMTARSLAAQLAVLMRDANLRRQFGQRAREVCARYAPAPVYDQWEDLLRESAACKGDTRLQNLPSLAEQQKTQARLREILCRPTPFTRCNFLETLADKDMIQKITQAWWYKLGRKLVQLWRKLLVAG